MSIFIIYIKLIARVAFQQQHSILKVSLDINIIMYFRSNSSYRIHNGLVRSVCSPAQKIPSGILNL